MVALTAHGASSGLALARARSALACSRLAPDVPLTRVSSVTNEVWMTDEVVIRVNRRLDQRLRREAGIAPYLPPELRYPEIIRYGAGTGFDFLILRRQPGTVLSRAWPAMSTAERRTAVRQLAHLMQTLHETSCPPSAGVPSHAPQLIGLSANGPCGDLLAALDTAKELPHVEPDLIGSVADLVRAAQDVLDPFDATRFVHGDLTFENVLWDGEQITALIDFEWARGAPADLDLDVLLRFCAYPFLHVAPDYEAMTNPVDYADVALWMSEDYPALFAVDRLLERLRLYSIAFDVRELLRHPPKMAAKDLSEHHALRRLARTVGRRSHLDRLAFADSNSNSRHRSAGTV